MTVMGTYVRDVMELNMESRNFRVFGPDETASNRLSPVFEVTGRRWEDPIDEHLDENLDRDGRVMDSMLSEHLCQGWLEGYLLTGRHGFFNSYEAFIRIVDSMVAQHAKWLKVCNQLPWRQKIASPELRPLLQRVAAGPQRLHSPGPRLPGSRGQQEGGRGAPLPAPGRQLPAQLLRPLHQEPQLRQRHGRLQAPPVPSG